MIKNTFTLPKACFTTLLIGLLFTTAHAQKLDIDKQIKIAEEKMKLTLAQWKDPAKFPRNIEKGEKEWKFVKYTDWTAGFPVGQLWMLYNATGKPYWKQQAITKQQGLLPVKDVTWTHDLGFMMFNSWGPGYQATKDPAMREALLTTTENLAALFNPKTGTMRSWTWMKNWHHPTIVDNMLNLEMLLWGAKEFNRPEWREMAITHATTTMKNHIRPDYTTYHVVVYDTSNGAVLEKRTHQGYADNSTWARGQAWGIYGFTMMYENTNKIEYLNTAQRLADKFIEMLPADKIPYWDFNAPGIPNEPRDASAAAITASALIKLSQLSPKGEGAKYLKEAKAMLTTLYNKPYNTRFDKQMPALLTQSTGSKPHNSEISVSLNYADYYYIEALLRLRELEGKK